MVIRVTPGAHEMDRSAQAFAARLGLWTSAIVTGLGIVYCAGLMILASTVGIRRALSSEPVQLTVAIGTLLIAQVVLAMVACIHRSVTRSQRAVTGLAVVFTALFAAMVSGNRLAQLIGIWQASPDSPAPPLVTLEILGWGFFLGLAALTLARAFRGAGLESAIRWAAIAYGLLSLVGVVGHALDNRLFVVGFAAWGFVFYVWTGLVAAWFNSRRARPGAPSPQP